MGSGSFERKRTSEDLEDSDVSSVTALVRAQAGQVHAFPERSRLVFGDGLVRGKEFARFCHFGIGSLGTGASLGKSRDGPLATRRTGTIGVFLLDFFVLPSKVHLVAFGERLECRQVFRGRVLGFKADERVLVVDFAKVLVNLEERRFNGVTTLVRAQCRLETAGTRLGSFVRRQCLVLPCGKRA